MPSDYDNILGLSPGRHSVEQLRGQFLARRAVLMQALDDPATGPAARSALEQLYLAYRVLRERAAAQRSPLRSEEPSPEDRLREMIRGALEDDLLRHSRRQWLIEQGARLGLPPFRVQLLIAQTQFEGVRAPRDARLPASEDLDTVTIRRDRALEHGVRQVGARLAAAGMLALALFLALITIVR